MPKRVLHTQKLCRNMQQGGCKDVLMAFMSGCLASFPLSMILEPWEELLNPMMPQVVLYEQLLTNRELFHGMTVPRRRHVLFGRLHSN